MDKFVCEDNLIERGCCRGNGGTCSKLEVYDWLNDVISVANPGELVEVRFKNTRKDYFHNVNHLKINPGDIVAVEANPGHDIGIVSLTGDLVLDQMKKHKVTLVNGELRKVYRKAKQIDIDKWKEAMQLEHQTMLRSRQIAADLKLDMKIGDVEYQGDKTKAIFYYIADERVDFRQLIKVLADTFRIRIEMKQIGARQEAGRIGGIGPCGRELCCATWIHSFISVTTNAARYQEISMNPQKLAGQCGKLKCCLNYEVDSYIDAQRDFPPTNIPLETEKGRYVFQKSEIFRGLYWYSLDNEAPLNQVAIPVERVKEIIRQNQKKRKVEKLVTKEPEMPLPEEKGYKDVIEQGSLTRFDDLKKAGGNKGRNKNRKFKRYKPQQKS
ncbi:MAG: regulatory iron-sulfur-containing complex subunit RicT [Prolixibacteraceae bacterium]|jgi:cell fate regulator YaaT (PSP1 superfamily)|nr:regulatory iron-sulfur-containing complex subunit RicT [Prolixibacteraceae bacterium]